MLLGAFAVSAQETHHINWFMGVSQMDASVEINPGDTVVWMWMDGMPHTVTSMMGSAEMFDSGEITGMGMSYSHTFMMEGETTYACNFHPMMAGTVTSSAVAGIGDNQAVSFEFFPNPVTDVLTINSGEIIDRIEMYDVNGRLIMDSKSGNTTSKVHMAGYPAGAYFVKVFTAGKTESFTAIKK